MTRGELIAITVSALALGMATGVLLRPAPKPQEPLVFPNSPLNLPPPPPGAEIGDLASDLVAKIEALTRRLERLEARIEAMSGGEGERNGEGEGGRGRPEGGNGGAGAGRGTEVVRMPEGLGEAAARSLRMQALLQAAGGSCSEVWRRAVRAATDARFDDQLQRGRASHLVRREDFRELIVELAAATGPTGEATIAAFAEMLAVRVADEARSIVLQITDDGAGPPGYAGIAVALPASAGGPDRAEWERLRAALRADWRKFVDERLAEDVRRRYLGWCSPYLSGSD